jgi:hypothetical protein
LIESNFSYGQTVNIKPLGGDGRIVAIMFYGVKPEYDVRYFHNGESKCVRFFEDELESK